MKTKLLTILLVLIAVLQEITLTVTASGTKNPYDYINAAAVDELQCKNANGKVYDADSGLPYIAYTSTKDNLIFKGYNFDIVPGYIDVTLGGGVGYSCDVNVCIDSPDSEPIAVVNYKSSGDKWYTGEITRAKILREVSGVHDIYFVYVRNTSNFFGFQFGAYSTVRAKKQLPRYVDLEGTEYQREVSLLVQLGIIPQFSGEKFDLDLPVTRGEFAEYIKNIMTLESYECSEATFGDVQPDSPYFEYVEYLKSRGIVFGTDGGTFEPYRFITPAEAETMIVRMLGYGDMIEQFGGLLALCSNLGILDNLSMDTKVVRRSELVTLLWNSLNAEYLSLSGVTVNGDESYPEYEGKKGILSYTRKINKGTGIVLKSELSGLYSPDSCTGSNQVLIGSNVYETSNTSIADYLGYKCEYFYSESKDSENTIVAFEPHRNVEVITLTTYGDNDKKLKDMSSRKVTYEYNNKTKDVDIRTDAAFIVNGKACDFDVDTLFANNDFTGKVILIDNGDGISCVYIDCYQNVLVESVIQDGDIKIFDKFSQTEIDLTDADIIYENSDIVADVSELKRGSYCVMHLSKNATGNRLCRIYVVNNTIEGKVTHKSHDELTINGVEYKLAKELNSEPLIGYEHKFYVNPYNEIVGYEDTISSIMFGCILSSGIDEEGIIFIKLIEQTGVISRYACKQKFILDGVKQTDGVTAKNSIDTVPKKSVVRYKLNDNDEITMLDTINPGAQNSNDKIECITKFTENDFHYVKNTGMIRKKGRNVYYINPNGFLFSTIQDPRSNDDVSCVVTSSVGSEDSVKWVLYTLSGSDSIADIVVVEDSSQRGGYKKAMIFDELYSAVDLEKDSSVVYDYISGYTVGGGRVSYQVSEYMTEQEKAVIKALQPGDFLKPKTNGDVLTGAEYLYFPGDNNIRGTKTSVLNSSKFEFGDEKQTYRTGIGYIKEFPEGHPTLMKVALGSVDGTCEYVVTGNVKVTVVDKSSHVVIENNYPVENLMVGDFILYNITSSSLDYLIVYR